MWQIINLNIINQNNNFWFKILQWICITWRISQSSADFVLQMWISEPQEHPGKTIPGIQQPSDCSCSLKWVLRKNVWYWPQIAEMHMKGRISVNLNSCIFPYICCCCSVTKAYVTLCDSIRCSMPACSNSCPLSWCHLINLTSVALFSCPQSFPASRSFPMNWFLA